MLTARQLKTILKYNYGLCVGEKTLEEVYAALEGIGFTRKSAK